MFLCFFAFYSSCFWKVRIENWMCIYVALFGIPGTYQNVEMYALTLREQRRFPVEVVTISFTVVPIPEDSGGDSSDVVTVFYSCADS